MNNKQRTALVVGLVVIVVMGLFPPYTDTTDGTVGYQFLFLKWAEKEPTLKLLPPDAPQEVWNDRERVMKRWAEDQKRLGRQLDGLMLLIQWVIVTAATGVFVVVLSDPYRRGSVSRPKRIAELPTVQTEDEAPFTELFCYHCGKPIEEGQSPCPACGKEVDWSKE
jgi:hypothetical protein